MSDALSQWEGKAWPKVELRRLKLAGGEGTFLELKTTCTAEVRAQLKAKHGVGLLEICNDRFALDSGPVVDAKVEVVEVPS